MEEHLKSRVVKVDSEESWNYFVNQSNSQGCPLVVHFTAAWCMPSVVMNQFFEELALQYHDILFVVVDVDDVKEVASKMEIKAMPTFIILRNEIQVDKVVGANPDEIKKRIDEYMNTIRVNINS
ncbi:Thioredoxin-like protein cxxs1 [Thalictrum thalictroides]|uniref:Thioredoxin-like protein cxxs1 n=1 Tax=Thalictrum thalictroides TaxID=46969 RepID=A0A7J6VLP0_THATH|nr:Thioredoxin-like protein cxxs1 [Thalictrum thalictroides]